MLKEVGDRGNDKLIQIQPTTGFPSEIVIKSFLHSLALRPERAREKPDVNVTDYHGNITVAELIRA